MSPSMRTSKAVDGEPALSGKLVLRMLSSKHHIRYRWRDQRIWQSGVNRSYGKFTIDEASGTYGYVLSKDLVKTTGETATDTFTVTTTDTANNAGIAKVVTVEGINDKPVDVTISKSPSVDENSAGQLSVP